jgi:hypothetical protein
MEAQEWLAAHIVAEQPVTLTEEDGRKIYALLSAAEAGDVLSDSWAEEIADPRTDEQRDLDEWQAEVTATRESDYPA